jgi:hypothetical protein
MYKTTTQDLTLNGDCTMCHPLMWQQKHKAPTWTKYVYARVTQYVSQISISFASKVSSCLYMYDFFF